MTPLRRKLLTGCIVFAGVLMVVAIVGVWWGLSWVREEAELPAATHPLVQGTESSYLDLTVDLEDEGWRDLLANLLDGLAARDLPDTMQMWEKVLDGLAAQEPEEGLGFYLPIRYVQLGYDAREPKRLTSTDFSKGYNVFRLALAPSLPPGTETTEHRGAKVHRLPGGSARSFVGSHLVQGSSLEVVKEAVDRLGASRESYRPATFDLAATAFVEAGADSTDVWGFLREAGPPLEDVLWAGEHARSASPEALDALRDTLADLGTVACSGDVVDARRLRGRIAVEWRGARSRDGGEEALRIRQLIEALLPSPLALEVEEASWRPAEEGGEPHLVLEGSIGPVEDYLLAWVDDLIEQIATAMEEGDAPPTARP